MNYVGSFKGNHGEQLLSWTFRGPSWKNSLPSWNFWAPSWKNHDPSWNRENMGTNDKEYDL